MLWIFTIIPKCLHPHYTTQKHIEPYKNHQHQLNPLSKNIKAHMPTIKSTHTKKVLFFLLVVNISIKTQQETTHTHIPRLANHKQHTNNLQPSTYINSSTPYNKSHHTYTTRHSHLPTYNKLTNVHNLQLTPSTSLPNRKKKKSQIHTNNSMCRQPTNTPSPKHITPQTTIRSPNQLFEPCLNHHNHPSTTHLLKHL